MCLQVSTFIHGYVIWPHANQLQGMKEKETGARMRQVSTAVMVVGVGCAMPPTARKQQLVFGNAGINSLHCIAQTGRVRLPMPPTLHFIWCSNRSPRGAGADADPASRRTHDQSPALLPLYLQASPYLLSSLFPRATTATSS
jgi:hypothetical protein